MIRNIILNAIFKTLCWIFKDIILLDHTSDFWLVFFEGGRKKTNKQQRQNFLRSYYHHFGKEKSQVKSFHKFSNQSPILKKLQTWANWLLFSFFRLSNHFYSPLHLTSFIYLFLPMLGLCHCVQVFCGGQGPLIIVVHRPLLWLLLLLSTGSRGLGFQELQPGGLSSPVVCGLFLDQGLNLRPLHGKVGS